MARVPPLAEYIYTPDVTLRRARAGAQLPRDETDEDFLDKPDGGACGGSTRAARMRAREHARAPPDERSVAPPAPVVAPPQQSSPAGPSVHFETGGSAGVRIPAGASAGIAPRDTAIRVRRWCAAAHRWGAWEEASVPHAPADTGDGDAAACAHDGAALTLRLRRGGVITLYRRLLGGARRGADGAHDNAEPSIDEPASDGAEPSAGGARADDVDEPAVGSARARISKAMEACAWRYRQVPEFGANELARP